MIQGLRLRWGCELWRCGVVELGSREDEEAKSSNSVFSAETQRSLH